MYAKSLKYIFLANLLIGNKRATLNKQNFNLKGYNTVNVNVD